MSTPTPAVSPATWRPDPSKIPAGLTAASIRPPRTVLPYPPCRKCGGKIRRRLCTWHSFPLCSPCLLAVEQARYRLNMANLDRVFRREVYPHQAPQLSTREYLIHLGLLTGPDDICA